MTQVLYAHSETPIKVWSTEMLSKLETDLFPNDDGGDTSVDEEAESEGKTYVNEIEIVLNV